MICSRSAGRFPDFGVQETSKTRQDHLRRACVKSARQTTFCLEEDQRMRCDNRRTISIITVNLWLVNADTYLGDVEMWLGRAKQQLRPQAKPDRRTAELWSC